MGSGSPKMLGSFVLTPAWSATVYILLLSGKDDDLPVAGDGKGLSPCGNITENLLGLSVSMGMHFHFFRVSLRDTLAGMECGSMVSPGLVCINKRASLSGIQNLVERRKRRSVCNFV